MQPLGYVPAMLDTTVEREVAATPEQVWAVLADFGNIAWIPPAGRVEVEGDGPGMVRRIHGSGDGPPVGERLVSRSDADRTIVYTIDENNPLPVASYRGTVSVEAAEGGAKVIWRADYEPGADEAESAAIVELMLGALIGWLADGVVAPPT